MWHLEYDTFIILRVWVGKIHLFLIHGYIKLFIEMDWLKNYVVFSTNKAKKHVWKIDDKKRKHYLVSTRCVSLHRNENIFWRHLRHWLRWKLSKNDNFQCNKWRKIHQNDISVWVCAATGGDFLITDCKFSRNPHPFVCKVPWIKQMSCKFKCFHKWI